MRVDAQIGFTTTIALLTGSQDSRPALQDFDGTVKPDDLWAVLARLAPGTGG